MNLQLTDHQDFKFFSTDERLTNRIFLLGFMGSGKSYVGKHLAPKLGYEFIDLDHYIEKESKKSIATIFETKGESAFREIESEILKSTAKKDCIIVSTGGGTPCFFDHIEWMNTNGTTIFLDVATPILVERLLPRTAHRPLLAGKSENEIAAYIEQKLEERRSFYEQSHIVLRQESTAQDRVEDILNMLGQK